MSDGKLIPSGRYSIDERVSPTGDVFFERWEEAADGSVEEAFAINGHPVSPEAYRTAFAAAFSR